VQAVQFIVGLFVTAPLSDKRSFRCNAGVGNSGFRSSGGQAMKRLVLSAVVFLIGGHLALAVAQTSPITFVFTGVGTGTIGGMGFADAAFTITAVGDTSTVHEFTGGPPASTPTIDSITATISISGIGVATFTEATRVFNSQTVTVVGFNSPVHADLYNIGPDASLATYDLVTDFGPIFDATPSAVNQFLNVSTSMGLLSFTSAQDGSFQAFVTGGPPPVTTTPPVISSLCGPSNPAPISGSTGAQGVLDAANADASQGLVWPANTVSVFINMDTGEALFFDSGGTQLGNPVLFPGLSGLDPVADGFHFLSMRLAAGKQVAFFTLTSGLRPPIILRSCQDVIMESGSSLSWAFVPEGPGALPGGFLGGSGSNAVSEGFGPRSGTLPAAGSLYPPIGGGGGKGGGGAEGGRGGPAFVISAARRLTMNGTIFANGLDAETGSSVGQGGAGGSVRLAGVLVEGVGIITTAGGADFDGASRSPSGPVEIQAFVNDLFTGASPTPIRGRPVVAPLPDNLPTIEVSGIEILSSEFFDSGFTNTGSLTEPDVELPAVLSPVLATVEAFTTGVPLGTLLTFRAVGDDGSVATNSSSVDACDCLEGEGFAFADLLFKPGVTYQVVVTPSTAAPDNSFPLARLGGNSFPAGMETVIYARDVPTVLRKTQNIFVPPSEEQATPSAEQWARAFGSRPEAHGKFAP